MSKLKEFFNKISNIGVNDSLELQDRHRIIFVNKMLMIAIISVAIFSINDFIIGIYIPSLLLALLASFLVFCIYLNAKGYTNASPFLSILVASLVIFTNAVLIKEDVGVQYILVSITGLPALTIDIRKKKLILFEMLILPLLGGIIILARTDLIGIYQLSEINQKTILYFGYFQAMIMLFFQTYIFLFEMDKRFNLYLENQSKIENQTRLSDLGIMTAGIAHEINNPLAVISGNADICVRKMDKGECTKQDIRETFKKIGVQTERIIKIIKGLKFVSRDGSNDPFDDESINKVIEDAYFLCEQKLSNSHVKSNLTLLKNDCRLKVRTVQVQQIILSLVSNSIDAMEDQSEKSSTIELYENGNFVHVRVRDNGPGISPELKGEILKPFFTTKPVGKGTGLGLSVANSIMEKHNGKLIIEESEKGASFVLQFAKSA